MRFQPAAPAGEGVKVPSPPTALSKLRAALEESFLMEKKKPTIKQ